MNMVIFYMNNNYDYEAAYPYDNSALVFIDIYR